ncbi:unnamed protein product [Rhizophagus irregularis]|uniref:Uncharacterized protein n=1 Tax=Rhizophagus irregularis TaxID=588596 RepID=A0A2I1GS85_9GLOM|nr:hypothetical protein RhiirA4_465394 [Rhizophagus irregularis]CAB4433173.1 unnamed protein product [Rhizophagus irregularis]CAB4433282.1 unnamed protein product [Rhizophagus irregularis]
MYYRAFLGFETTYIDDFAKTLKEFKRFQLEEYEKKHLDKDMLFPTGRVGIGIRDETKRIGANLYKDILMDTAAFTIKKGGEITKIMLEAILLQYREKSAVNDTAVEELKKTKDELEL